MLRARSLISKDLVHRLLMHNDFDKYSLVLKNAKPTSFVSCVFFFSALINLGENQNDSHNIIDAV